MDNFSHSQSIGSSDEVNLHLDNIFEYIHIQRVNIFIYFYTIFELKVVIFFPYVKQIILSVCSKLADFAWANKEHIFLGAIRYNCWELLFVANKWFYKSKQHGFARIYMGLLRSPPFHIITNTEFYFALVKKLAIQ